MNVSSNIAGSIGGPQHSGHPPPEDGAGESLRQTYDRYFKVELANSDEMRDSSYRLRYQVYCVENEYESVSENPDGRETDDFDPQSRHGLLIHRDTGTIVGTSRLILPQVSENGLRQPIYEMCSPEIVEEFIRQVPVDQTAELSRFAIAKEFRRRSEDKGTVTGGLTNMVGENPRRVIPHISLGLMQAAISIAKIEGMSHLYAFMEPSLLRMLRRLGIYFENLGPIIDYHGRRQPCFCDLDQLLATTWREHPEVWEVMTDEGRIWPLNPEKASISELSPT